jgi:hypothetical protein
MFNPSVILDILLLNSCPYMSTCMPVTGIVHGSSVQPGIFIVNLFNIINGEN